MIDYASDGPEAMGDEITLATNGCDERGVDIGVSDVQDSARMSRRA
ncbi:hypothetical protein [Streptomyces atratus]|nr:hypothetical protein [Streptomyces atratus]